MDLSGILTFILKNVKKTDIKTSRSGSVSIVIDDPHMNRKNTSVQRSSLSPTSYLKME